MRTAITEPIAKSLSLNRILLYIAVLVAWATTALMPNYTAIPQYSALYFIVVLPAILLAANFILLLIVYGRVPLSVLILLLLLVYVTVLSLARGDRGTLVTTTIMIFALCGLITGKNSISLKVLNRIYLISIGVGLITYYLQINKYGIIPFLGGDPTLPWRISIFPNVVPSAYFSALILLLNKSQLDVRHRRSMMLVALFFLIFAGLRSILILVMTFWIAHELLRRWAPRYPMLALLSTVALVALAVTIPILGQDLLIQLSQMLGGGLTSYLFRSDTGVFNREELVSSFYRYWLWTEHLRIAQGHLWSGIGAFNFQDLAFFPLGTNNGTGSESYFTALITKIGLIGFMLMVSVFIIHAYRGFAQGRLLIGLMAIILIGAGFLYGSIFQPYNFSFLLWSLTIFANTNRNNDHQSAGLQGADPQETLPNSDRV